MSRYQHVLLGGLFIGVVSALPIVGSANVCCCLWVVICGLLSTYLLQQNRSEPVESGEVAGGGLVAGLLGAIIHIFLQLAVFSVAGAEVETELRQMLERTSEMGPEMREFMARMSSPRNLM